MLDISVDEAKAKAWIDDVTAELEAVEKVLEKVRGSLTESAGEDDTIMNGIYKVGQTMETVWTGMCKGFRTSQDLLFKGLRKIVDGTGAVLDNVETLRHSVEQ